MSTRQPQDGDLVELRLNDEGSEQAQRRYHGQDQEPERLVRGRVFAKTRGLSFAVSLFVPKNGWESVPVGGADCIASVGGQRITFLAVEDLTLEEQLHHTFEDSNGGRYSSRLPLFEENSDRYNRKSGEGVGFVWHTGDQGELALTLYARTYHAETAQMAVQVRQETSGYPEYDLQPTFSVVLLRKDYRDMWESGYRMDAFNREGLTPIEAVRYAAKALHTATELVEGVERAASDLERQRAKKTAIDMLQPYLKAFFKEHGETPGV